MSFEPSHEKTNNLHIWAYMRKQRRRSAVQLLSCAASIIPLLLIFKVSWCDYTAGLCRTLSETQIVGFLMHMLILCAVCDFYHSALFDSLRKLIHAINRDFLALKIEHFQLKKFDIFLIFAQNIRKV